MSAGRLLFFMLLAGQGKAQPILSAHSGVIDFFEGAVSLDGLPMRADQGRFVEMPAGSSLETQEGRAEVLLGPGVFLWLGRHSAISMVRNQLENSAIQLVKGSAVVLSMEPLPANSINILSEDRETTLAASGMSRINIGGSAQTRKENDELDRWAEERRRAIVRANSARARISSLGTAPDRKKHQRTRAAGPLVSLPPPQRTWR